MLQEGDCTRPSKVVKTWTLRVPNSVAIPKLASYCEEVKSLQCQQPGIRLPVWLRLQLNDREECGPLRVSVAVQQQPPAESGFKFLVYDLHDVFQQACQPDLLRATCWEVQLPKLFCRIRCSDADAELLQGVVQALQQDTTGFSMLEPSFHDLQVTDEVVQSSLALPPTYASA